jgi:hypothetical protein
MQTPEELYGSIERIEKAFGIDKSRPTSVKGIAEHLGDSTLLAFGALVVPTREDDEHSNRRKDHIKIRK